MPGLPTRHNYQHFLPVCKACNAYSLDLTTPYHPRDFFPSQHSVPKENNVAMSELTHIRYLGHPIFLDYLMSGLSAPFLQDAHFVPCTEFPCFSRVIDDVREEFRSVSVLFDIY